MTQRALATADAQPTGEAVADRESLAERLFWDRPRYVAPMGDEPMNAIEQAVVRLLVSAITKQMLECGGEPGDQRPPAPTMAGGD